MNHLKILTINVRTYTFSFLREYRLGIAIETLEESRSGEIWIYCVSMDLADVLQVKVKKIKMPVIDFSVYWGVQKLHSKHYAEQAIKKLCPYSLIFFVGSASI